MVTAEEAFARVRRPMQRPGANKLQVPAPVQVSAEDDKAAPIWLGSRKRRRMDTDGAAVTVPVSPSEADAAVSGTPPAPLAPPVPPRQKRFKLTAENLLRGVSSSSLPPPTTSEPVNDSYHAPLTSDTSPPTALDENTEPQTAVVLGTCSLRPQCNHGKGKATLTESRCYTRCDPANKEWCREAVVVPTPTTSTADFMLTTADPAHDLRWWLGASALGDEERDTAYISHSRFTAELLRGAILQAVEQLRDLHAETERLVLYAARAPLQLTLCNALIHTNTAYFDLRAGDLAGLDRETLVEDLVQVVRELDYVGARRAKVQGLVTGKLMKVAKSGEGGQGWKGVLTGLGYWDEVAEMD
ncbi:hypothetical protein LTR53_009242 [Teratosphaeriaceae sp. CCFEE 6253]|nr:hypothetical protein LTR53_009242 [Teratosphaeriaceae sp. CCFEE 6253]